jgi:hypothetical protein
MLNMVCVMLVEKNILKQKYNKIILNKVLKQINTTNRGTGRLRILIGMWEKGREVSAVCSGLETAPSWRELSRQTGRAGDALKKWHDTYKQYPDRDKYIAIAEENGL